MKEWEKTMTENELDQMEAQGNDVTVYREKLAARRAQEAEQAKRDREMWQNPTNLGKLAPYIATPRSAETPFFKKVAGKAPWFGKKSSPIPIIHIYFLFIFIFLPILFVKII